MLLWLYFNTYSLLIYYNILILSYNNNTLENKLSEKKFLTFLDEYRKIKSKKRYYMHCGMTKNGCIAFP